MIAASSIPTIWREKPLVDYATRVTIRMLDKMSHNSGGIDNIRTLSRNIDRIFGLNVVDAQRAKMVIEAWLRTGPGGGGIIT